MRRVTDRELSSIALAPFQARHWRALRTGLRDIRPAAQFFWRYLSQRGIYPWTVAIRTPTGDVSTTLYSRHDLLTVNEVFCRQDYPVPTGPLVVDIGANIGISALYFLTRRHDVRVWCYEPNPANVQRLSDNLNRFEDRVTIREVAVASRSGRMPFRTEPSGRYGHVSEDCGDIEVEVVAISDLIGEIGDNIDLMKIDIEVNEAEVLDAVPLGTVREIVWEDSIGVHRQVARS